MARETHTVWMRPVVYSDVGRIASLTFNTLTMESADDTKRIHVGMFLRAGSSVSCLRNGQLLVVETNEENGTVTVEHANAVPSLCPDDRLFGRHGSIAREHVRRPSHRSSAVYPRMGSGIPAAHGVGLRWVGSAT